MPLKDRAAERKYQNAWMKKKLLSDPEYKKKRNAANALQQKNKIKSDPEYRERRLESARKYRKKKQENDPEYSKKISQAVGRSNERYMSTIQDLLDIFRKNGCKKCKEKRPDCLCAHHKNPELKEFEIGAVRVIKPTREVLKKELDKCICLCLNCHAIHHARKRRREKKRNAR